MDGSGLIRLESVGKDYPRVQHAGSRLRNFLAALRARSAVDYYRALDDVSLVVKPGESLGLIGENGAGKSTLLKIIAGVIKPSRGSCSIKGRVSALLELGSGFHPDYTGMENIDLAAALMGFSASQLRAKRDEIIAFADIGEHIHQPIKHYSSGMVVRLGFAVATALDPEVLITDEVLAVGDESFQKKCIQWVESFTSRGGTLLLCSHSMYHIQKLCRHALWLQNGRPRLYGEANDVAQQYIAYHERKSKADSEMSRPVGLRPPLGAYVVTHFEIVDDDGQKLTELGSSRAFIARGTIFSDDGRVPNVVVGIGRVDGTPVYGTTSEIGGCRPRRVDQHTFRFAIRFSELPLLPGTYVAKAHAMDPEAVRVFDAWEIEFVASGISRELGLCRLNHRWLDADQGQGNGSP